MTDPVRVPTDDLVYKVRAVWLGPPGYSFPFHARYLAYAIFAPLFVVAWGFEALVGFVEVIPLYAFCFALLGTYGVMSLVDHDVTLRALIASTRSQLRRRDRHQPDGRRYTNTKVTVR